MKKEQKTKLEKIELAINIVIVCLGLYLKVSKFVLALRLLFVKKKNKETGGSNICC